MDYGILLKFGSSDAAKWLESFLKSKMPDDTRFVMFKSL